MFGELLLKRPAPARKPRMERRITMSRKLRTALAATLLALAAASAAAGSASAANFGFGRGTADFYGGGWIF